LQEAVALDLALFFSSLAPPAVIRVKVRGKLDCRSVFCQLSSRNYLPFLYRKILNMFAIGKCNQKC